MTLNGSKSYDEDGSIASYVWKQTSGPTMPLSDPTAVTPTFVAAPVDLNGALLEFELVVVDNEGLKASNTVSVTIHSNDIAGYPNDAVAISLSSQDTIGITVDGGTLIDLYLVNANVVTSKSVTSKASRKPSQLLWDALIAMKIKVPARGDQVYMTFYFDKPAPTNSRLYHYDSLKILWTDFTEHATFDNYRNQVTFMLVDGGTGDEDGTANGVIVDPFTMGIEAITAEQAQDVNTASGDDGGGGGGCFVGSVSHETLTTRDVYIVWFLIFTGILFIGYVHISKAISASKRY